MHLLSGFQDCRQNLNAIAQTIFTIFADNSACNLFPLIEK